MARKKPQASPELKADKPEELMPLEPAIEQSSAQTESLPIDSAQQVLHGSNIHPAIITIDGTEHQLGEFVAAAQEASGLSVEDWNKLPGTALDQHIDAAIVAAGGPSSLPVAQEPTSSEPVECAVLHDSIYGKHDDIIELPVEEAEAARAAGYVDTHPNAIKAIRQQG